jgi:hypothetical protein
MRLAVLCKESKTCSALIWRSRCCVSYGNDEPQWIISRFRGAFGEAAIKAHIHPSRPLPKFFCRFFSIVDCRVNSVQKLIVGQGMKLASMGIALGLLASLALTRLMKSLLFGVGATDLPTFGIVAFMLAMVALLACHIPARRATKIDPMITLRCE